MAEHDRDDDLSRRYRELAREDPPSALDDAILAAARRELETRPAPLVAPTGRRRWSVPIAAAAVIVLSAVVTLHVQREQPDPELGGVPQPQPPAAARKDEASAIAPRAEMREEKLSSPEKDIAALRAPVEAPKAQPERRRAQEAPAAKAVKPSQAPVGESPALARAPAEPKPLAEQERFSPDPAPAVAAPPPAPPPSSAPPQMQMRQAAPAAKPAPRAADSASTAGASPPAAAEDRDALGGLRDGGTNRMLAKREIAAESPEKMLERIAALRREGRGKEADDLYAEFKRRFPDYRIPDALREQVVPR